MELALATAIDNRNGQVLQVFKPPFDTREGWYVFLHNYMYRTGGTAAKFVDAGSFTPDMAPPSTGFVPDLFRNQDSRARKHDCRGRLQELYIACWTTFPIEKGTFMIRLDPGQLAMARSMLGTLPTRGSSHLEGNWRGGGYSAGGKTFQFMEGYDELLVQIHENELMLKMEGHQVGLAHVKSYFEKAKTGAGLTASAQLHELATQGGLGITARAAENFGKPYEALVEKLGFSGKIRVTPVSAVLKRLTEVCGRSNFTTFHRQWFLGYPEDCARFIRALLEECKRNSAILANPGADPALGALAAFLRAETDLQGILQALERDAQSSRRHDSNYERFQGEIKLEIREIDAGVSSFLRFLDLPPWEKPAVN